MHESQEPTLGDCPVCQESIGEDRLVVEYEANGSQRVYAECPDCLNLVHPRQ